MTIRNFSDIKVKIKTEDILKENIVYKLTFPNNKVYIGQTRQKLDIRLKGHCNDSFNIKKNCFNTKKSRAIRKYMEFSVDILYQGNDLDSEEIKFIKELKAIDNGYNITEGGFNHFSRVMSDETKEKLRQSGIKRGISDEMLNKATEIKKKPVIQLSLTGEFIKEWESTKEASKELKIGRTSIKNCLNGLSKTGKGFIWKFKNK